MRFESHITLTDFIISQSFTFMTENRLSQLEASIQFLKEKVTNLQTKLKNNEFGKSQLENRMSNIQNKIIALSSMSSKVEKQNLNNFDVHLSSSTIFASNLKKVDNNATSNLRKLEEHFGQLIQQSYTKFAEIEEKLLGMMTQKEKILRNMNFQIENQNHAINAIQQWIRTDHQQVNSLHIVEENLRQRVEMMQKNTDIKVQVLEEKLKYLEQFKESVQIQIKNMSNKKQQEEDEIKSVKKLMRKEIQALEERLEAQISRINDKSQSISKVKGQIGRTQDQVEQLKRKQAKQTLRMEELEQEQTNLAKKTPFREQGINKSAREPTNQDKKEYKGDFNHERINSSYEQKRKRQPNQYSFGKQIPENKAWNTVDLEVPKSTKKELPPRRGLFHETSVKEQQQFSLSPDMRGGVRGLLQKSKGKDRMTNRESQSGSKKGLPPVRDDPLSRKKKNERQKLREQEEEEVVYQLDEEGYLLDEDGNYLQDQYGNMIKLSPQEIQQYVTEQ